MPAQSDAKTQENRLGRLSFFLPGVFSCDSSSVDFKKYINVLEQQSSSYEWTDIKPGSISWEYRRATKKAPFRRL
jgi:hypothetical protein